MGSLTLRSRHRIMCGDSTDPEDVARLIDGDTPPLLFTSPPYLAQRVYEIGDFDWGALMDGVRDAVFPLLSADASMLINLGLVHRDGRVIRYWDDWITRTENAGWPLYGWYVWDQGWGLPGDWAGRLAPSFEFIFHFGREPRHTTKTASTKTPGKVRNSTFRDRDGTLHEFTGNGGQTGDHKVPDSVVRVHRQIGRVAPGADHPAAFSVGFPEALAPVWTQSGEGVVDPFLGSGTTLIAAERIGRRCYGMEIEPKYVQVAIARFEAYTGEKAVRLDG